MTSTGAADRLEQARLTIDAELNRLFLEPVRHGRYPACARPEVLPPAALIADGDLSPSASPSTSWA